MRERRVVYGQTVYFIVTKKNRLHLHQRMLFSPWSIELMIFMTYDVEGGLPFSIVVFAGQKSASCRQLGVVHTGGVF